MGREQTPMLLPCIQHAKHLLSGCCSVPHCILAPAVTKLVSPDGLQKGHRGGMRAEWMGQRLILCSP